MAGLRAPVTQRVLVLIALIALLAAPSSSRPGPPVGEGKPPPALASWAPRVNMPHEKRRLQQLSRHSLT